MIVVCHVLGNGSARPLEVNGNGNDLQAHLDNGDYYFPTDGSCADGAATAGVGRVPGDSPVGFLLLAGALVGAYAFGFWRRLRTG